MSIGSGGIVEVFLPPGGTAGQVLAKIDGVDYNTTWQASGGGGGSALFTEVTVDFGAVGVDQQTFDVAVIGATTGQKVIAVASLTMPAGVDEDELEMDMLACAARVVSVDTVRLIIASLGDAISGQRNINLSFG